MKPFISRPDQAVNSESGDASRFAWILWSLPLALAMASFAAGLGGDFALDDPKAIIHNPVVNESVPFYEAFIRNYWGGALDQPPPSYRPLATLSFRLDHWLFGLAPLAFHIISLLYYLLLTHLGQRLSRLWLDGRAACLAACFFATMPLHTENVSSIVGRADTLGLMFMILSLLCLKPALKGKSTGPLRLIGAVAAYLAALLCKESAAILPAMVLVLIEFTSRKRSGLKALFRRHHATALLVAAGVVYITARMAIMPITFKSGYIVDDVLADANLWQRMVFGTERLFEYAAMVLAPTELCTGRKYAEVALPSGVPTLSFVLGLVIMALLVWRTVRNYKRRQPPFLLCAFIAWSLFSSVLFPVPEAMADRFMLTPSYFLLLPLGALIGPWTEGSKSRTLVIGLLLAGQLALSVFYATRWRSTLTLLEHGVTACPDSVHNHFRLAKVLSYTGRHGEAVWHYAIASEGRRNFPNPWQHPAIDAETTMPIGKRLQKIHALLKVKGPEPAWRMNFMRFLSRQGKKAEAELVRATSPRPLKRYIPVPNP